MSPSGIGIADVFKCANIQSSLSCRARTLTHSVEVTLVVAGGSAASSGRVHVGDVLQAISSESAPSAGAVQIYRVPQA